MDTPNGVDVGDLLRQAVAARSEPIHVQYKDETWELFRPDAVRIIELRQKASNTVDLPQEERIAAHARLIGEILQSCLPERHRETYSIDMLTVLVIERGGINGDFANEISSIAGMSEAASKDAPFISPENSELPSDNSGE